MAPRFAILSRFSGFPQGTHRFGRQDGCHVPASWIGGVVRKTIVALAALLVLVSGAVAWAHTGTPATRRGRSDREELERILADLVATGIITQEKSDTIVSVLEEIRVADRPAGPGWACTPAKRMAG